MDVEVVPPQPEEVVRAVAELLRPPANDASPDPWWRAGVEENLRQE